MDIWWFYLIASGQNKMLMIGILSLVINIVGNLNL